MRSTRPLGPQTAAMSAKDGGVLRVTPLGDGCVLVEPGIAFDPSQCEEPLERLLARLGQIRPVALLYDLGSVNVIDSIYYAWLERLERACRISGVRMIAVNIRPHAAYALALRLEAPCRFETARDVDAARKRVQEETAKIAGTPSATATDDPADTPAVAAGGRAEHDRSPE